LRSDALHVIINSGWWVLAGVRPVKADIPLVWFDYVMRRAGPALPVPALAMRW
jgi:hypothetical protein